MSSVLSRATGPRPPPARMTEVGLGRCRAQLRPLPAPPRRTGDVARRRDLDQEHLAVAGQVEVADSRSSPASVLRFPRSNLCRVTGRAVSGC